MRKQEALARWAQMERKRRERIEARQRRNAAFAVAYRVGPLFHWRIGAVGGSLYVRQTIRRAIVARVAAFAIGAALIGSAF